MNTQRRICLLCGRAFVVRIPEGTEDPERDRLCLACLSLPTPPEEPGGLPSKPSDRQVLRTIMEVRNNKVARAWVYFDNAHLLPPDRCAAGELTLEEQAAARHWR